VISIWREMKLINIKKWIELIQNKNYQDQTKLKIKKIIKSQTNT